MGFVVLSHRRRKPRWVVNSGEKLLEVARLEGAQRNERMSFT